MQWTISEKNKQTGGWGHTFEKNPGIFKFCFTPGNSRQIKLHPTQETPQNCVTPPEILRPKSTLGLFPRNLISSSKPLPGLGLVNFGLKGVVLGGGTSIKKGS